MTLRQIAGSEKTSATVFWFTVSTSLAAGCLMPAYAHARDLGTMALLVCAGLFGGIGQIAVTASLRFAPVSVVMPFDYLQVIWATLIGWLLLANVPPTTMLAGAALIIASGVYTGYREARIGRQPAQALAAPEA